MFLSLLGEDSDSGARFKASRLIRTEVNYISGKATTKAYEESGIEEYTYLATLDKRTCHDCGDSNRKSCAELDGKHFKVSEAEVGVNKHPMHPFCRCSDCPYIPGRKTVRAARDENGKSIQVPGDMTYDEWWDRYVEPVDNVEKSDIISENNDIGESDVHYIGKIDRSIYSCITDDITTDEVIITDKQIEHIKQRHPDDFERYYDYIKEIVESPDYILEANKPNTAFVLKHIVNNGKNYQLILRLKTANDPKDYKNSVITFLKVDDKKWAKYLRNKKILYEKNHDIDNSV